MVSHCVAQANFGTPGLKQFTHLVLPKWNGCVWQNLSLVSSFYYTVLFPLLGPHQTNSCNSSSLWSSDRAERFCHTMGNLITKSTYISYNNLWENARKTLDLTLKCFFWLTSLSEPSFLTYFIAIVTLFRSLHLHCKIYPSLTWVSSSCHLSFLDESSHFPRFPWRSVKGKKVIWHRIWFTAYRYSRGKKFLHIV